MAFSTEMIPSLTIFLAVLSFSSSDFFRNVSAFASAFCRSSARASAIILRRTSPALTNPYFCPMLTKAMSISLRVSSSKYSSKYTFNFFRRQEASFGEIFFSDSLNFGNISTILGPLKACLSPARIIREGVLYVVIFLLLSPRIYSGVGLHGTYYIVTPATVPGSACHDCHARLRAGISFHNKFLHKISEQTGQKSVLI